MSTAVILPDVLAPGLDLVLCGTAPSRVSHRLGAYYANPGNAFWPSLAAAGLTPARLSPQDYARLPAYGLGLTDMNKVEVGNDADLSPAATDVAAFRDKLLRYRPAAVAFTSKNAATPFLRAECGLDGPPAYGRQPRDWNGIVLFVLPSPSGQARRFFDLEPWREAGRFVTGRRQGRIA